MEFPNIVETKSKGEKMYLISAYFDEHTTRQLQRFIDAVAQNTGNTYIMGFQFRQLHKIIAEILWISCLKT